MYEETRRSAQWPGPVDGERLQVVERIVVADARGTFRPLAEEVVGTVVDRGQPIGTIEQRGASRPVLSRFGGRVMGMLVLPGEMVREGEPIAWLRVS